MRLDRLPSRDDEKHVHVVVEAPRGAQVKLKYEPDLGVITLGRPLPLGLAYPFDWGFVPSTLAPDGDPLDAMVLHDSASYPGVVVKCALVGVVRISQKTDDKKRRERNDRVIAVPAEAPRWKEIRSPKDLVGRVRKELEHFFGQTTAFTEKDVELLGWGDAREAERLLREAERAYASKRSTQERGNAET